MNKNISLYNDFIHGNIYFIIDSMVAANSLVKLARDDGFKTDKLLPYVEVQFLIEQEKINLVGYIDEDDYIIIKKPGGLLNKGACFFTKEMYKEMYDFVRGIKKENESEEKNMNSNEILKGFKILIIDREKKELNELRNELCEKDEAVSRVNLILTEVNKKIEEYEKLNLDNEVIENIKRAFDINGAITYSTRQKIEEETKKFDMRIEKFCSFLNTVAARLSICETCDQVTNVLKEYEILDSRGRYNELFYIEGNI